MTNECPACGCSLYDAIEEQPGFFVLPSSGLSHRVNGERCLADQAIMARAKIAAAQMRARMRHPSNSLRSLQDTEGPQ